MLSALLDRVVHLVLVPAHVLDVHLFARVLGAEAADPQDVLACGTQRGRDVTRGRREAGDVTWYTAGGEGQRDTLAQSDTGSL